MDISNSTSVNAAVNAAANGAPGSVENAVGLLVLRKAMDTQEAGAAALLAALPAPPTATPLASEGSLGRNVNTYA